MNNKDIAIEKINKNNSDENAYLLFALFSDSNSDIRMLFSNEPSIATQLELVYLDLTLDKQKEFKYSLVKAAERWSPLKDDVESLTSILRFSCIIQCFEIVDFISHLVRNGRTLNKIKNSNIRRDVFTIIAATLHSFSEIFSASGKQPIKDLAAYLFDDNDYYEVSAQLFLALCKCNTSFEDYPKYLNRLFEIDRSHPGYFKRLDFVLGQLCDYIGIRAIVDYINGIEMCNRQKFLKIFAESLKVQDALLINNQSSPTVGALSILTAQGTYTLPIDFISPEESCELIKNYVHDNPVDFVKNVNGISRHPNSLRYSDEVKFISA
jgi:hypothetical protein